MAAIRLTMVRDTTMQYVEGQDGEEGSSTSVDVTTPVTVNTAHIRSFNPRKDNAVGTRLTFVCGNGFAVTEDYETVCAMIGMPSNAPAIAAA